MAIVKKHTRVIKVRSKRARMIKGASLKRITVKTHRRRR